MNLPSDSPATECMCPVYRAAESRPGRLALWTEDWEWTYADLNQAIGTAQALLREKGVGEGSRVAIRLGRGPAYVVLFWALWRMGAVAVPISTRLPSPAVFQYVERAGAEVLLTDDREFADRSKEGIRIVAAASVVFSEAGAQPSPEAQVLDRLATILFTSGSTGTPKAVFHSWENHLYSAKGSNANIRLEPGDRWLLSLPLYHVGGLAILVRCALAGAAVAVPPPDESLGTQLSASGATHASFVAAQFRRVLESTDGAPPDQLRALLLGGGPLPETLLRRGYERGWPLHTSYGSTEMASQVTTTSPGAPIESLLTAGRRLPHRRFRIDESGQILVAGRTLAERVVDEEGVERETDTWHPTGDLGFVDAQGRLHVTGRRDRQFVSGGENIQPEEIETALERLPGVLRAVVVAVPHEEYGHRPVGFVRTASGDGLDEWEQELASALPRYKIPDAVFELPAFATEEASGGKVDFESLREWAGRHT